MGYDIYGIKPQINSEEPGIIKEFSELGYNEMSPTQREAYFRAKDRYEEDNPGIYFRNNVWWWRPLWEYISRSCNDILSEKDIIKGDSNSGGTISATKAKKIANRLEKLMKDGSVREHEEEYEHSRKNAKLIACDSCEGTGIRDINIDTLENKAYDYELFNDWLIERGFKLRKNDDNKWEVQDEDNIPVQSTIYKAITGCPAVVCYSCRGVGKKTPFWVNYPFSLTNVADFLKFADQSGGFQIY